MLYHGTRGTDPKYIYDGEEGFNMLFSSGGMWGKQFILLRIALTVTATDILNLLKILSRCSMQESL